MYYVYILANRPRGAIYIGMTSDLEKRMFEHKNNLVQGFTKKYHIHTLVYYESTEDRNAALLQEKKLKKWRRPWKNKLIEKTNPEWKDISKAWFKYTS